MESTQTFPRYASVILDAAVDKLLDYGISEEHASKLKRGMRVQVPVRGTLRTAYVYEIKEKSDFPKVLPLAAILSEHELIGESLFELALWMSRYYGTPLRKVIKSMLPASIRQGLAHKEQYFVKRMQSKEKLRPLCETLREKHPAQAAVLDEMLCAQEGLLLSELLEKSGVSRSPVESLVKKGILQLEQIQIDRSPLIGETYFKTSAKSLNSGQAEALKKIVRSMDGQSFETHLLFGITGSGKTEVYLQAIENVLKLGRSSVILVPEIALTAQTIERFRARFDTGIAVLHHRLSAGERRDEWHRIRKGEAKIVIGARSALFCPLQNLGLILVDEEHDGAYKQSEEAPCYHARDVAVMLGKMTNATVVLGSATPSLESYRNAMEGKYTLSKLTCRATSAKLAHVKIVDMKAEFEKAGGFTTFSAPLIEGIQKRLELGEQTILFLNRRGYHTSLSCKGCGHIFHCPHCDVTLTFHRSKEQLSCHLCKFQLVSTATQCPQCKSYETLKYRGIGTEQVERTLHALFPGVRSLRADGDTTQHKGSHERLFRAFGTGKADVLIGTQMVTKGLHFPAVTLVAVLNADSSLHIPDFRASEQVFQLITQVAGRAGRGALPGEVIIQTQIPSHPIIEFAAAQDYEAFYETEVAVRKQFAYPPFTHLVKLTFSGPNPSEVQATATEVRDMIEKNLDKQYEVHPVTPSGYAKIKDQYRFQCLIRGVSTYPITALLSRLTIHSRRVKLHLDVDPLSTFF